MAVFRPPFGYPAAQGGGSVFPLPFITITDPPPEPAGTPVTWSSTDLDTGNITLSNDDKTATKTAAGTRSGAGAAASTAKSSGKWYAEFVPTSATSSFLGFGISPVSSPRNVDLGQNANTYSYFRNGGRYLDGSYTGFAYTPYTTGAVIGIEVDIDTGTIEYFRDGVSQGLESVTLDAAPYVLAMSADLVPDGGTLITVSGEGNYGPSSGFTWWGE